MSTKQLHTLSNRTRVSLPRPLVNLSLAFICGVVYAKYFPISIPVVLVLFLLSMTAWFAWGKKNDRSNKNTPLIILLFLASLLGAVRMESQQVYWHNTADEMQQAARMGPQIISGTIVDIHSNAEGGGSVLIDEVSAEKWKRATILPGKIEVRAPQSVLKSFNLGNQIACEAQIIPIRGPSIPTSFDFQEFNAAKNIFGRIYLNTNASIQMKEGHQVPSSILIRGIAFQCVDKIRNYLESNHQTPDKITSLIASICFGIRGDMPTALRNQLQESGLAHITSISGLHVTMILLLLFKGLKAAGLKRKQSAWLTIAASVFYLCLVGFRVPAIRSVLMAFIVMGKHMIQRKADPLNSMGLAALVLLLLNPSEIFLASFQLSFIATLILLLTIPYDKWLQKKICNKPLLWLIRGTAGSIIVVIALAPFTIYYFHMLSWGSIFGNLIAVPIVILLLPLTYVWSIFLFTPLQPINDGLGYIVASLSETLSYVTYTFAHPIFWKIIPVWNIYTASTLLLFLLLVSKPRNLWFSSPLKIYSYQLALVVLIIYGAGTWIATSYQPLRIDFLALGQADCIFIQTPDGKTMLIDGGSPAYKKRDNRFSRLEDYLLTQGVSRIDVVVLSHPQTDHIGDLANIARNFEIGLFLEGVKDNTSSSYNELTTVLQSKNITPTQVKKGDSFQLGIQTTCWILHPQTTENEFSGDINEQSVVIMMESLGKRFLFTGDIGKSTENKLITLFDHWDTGVLKVPHHGSRYSTTEQFLHEIQPETAIIQVGRNTYGHPHEDTRNRLYDVNAHVLRNDYDGTIRLQTFGNGYKIYTTQSKRHFIYE